MKIRSRIQYLAVLSSALMVALEGCASRPINEPIAQVDPKSGYRPQPGPSAPGQYDSCIRNHAPLAFRIEDEGVDVEFRDFRMV